MPRPIDTTFREMVVEAYLNRKADDPKTTIRMVAKEHGVGEASLKRWVWASRSGSVRPKRASGGPRPRLTAEMRTHVVDWVLAHPTVRLFEVVAYVQQTFQVSVSEATIRACLRERGIGKRRLTKLVPRQGSEGTPPDHRYTRSHRRKPEGRPHRRAYPSDFTDAEWSVVGPLWLDHASAVPLEHELRDVLDALRYIGATGSPWRYLPHDYPPQETVRRWFDTWGRDGSLTRVNDALRRLLRRRAGREETPSVLIIDSLSVKSHEGGEARGYDGGKKIHGRKRHIAVDSMGLVWLAMVHGADIQDRDGIDRLIPDDIRAKLPRLGKILADAGYQGRAETRTQERTGVPVEIVRRPGDTTTGEWATADAPPKTAPTGFVVVPKRWVVERSHAWAARRRRLARDFERTVTASTTWLEMSYNHIYSARAGRC